MPGLPESTHLVDRDVPFIARRARTGSRGRIGGRRRAPRSGGLQGKERPLKARSCGWAVSSVMRRWSALAVLMLVPVTALAGYKVYEKDDQSLEVGMRLQPRMEYSRIGAASGTGTE